MLHVCRNVSFDSLKASTIRTRENRVDFFTDFAGRDIEVKLADAQRSATPREPRIAQTSHMCLCVYMNPNSGQGSLKRGKDLRFGCIIQATDQL